MKKKLYWIIALVVALTVSGGAYAYTYTTATGTIGITEPTGDVATWEEAAGQPNWNAVLPGDGEVTEQLDQQMAIYEDHWHDIRENKFWAQSFVAGLTGDLTKVALYLKRKGTPEPLIIELRNSVILTDGDGDLYAPGDTIYTSIETSDVVSTTGEEYEFIFSTPASVTSGTYYTIVLHQKQNGGNKDNKYEWSEAHNNPYEAGNNSKTDDGGATWKRGGGKGTHDQYFKTYVEAEAPPVIEGEVPTGNLFVVTPHPDYTGDLLVKVYLTNTGALIKAYQHLNMKLYLQGSVEAPNYRLLTLQNGEVAFNLENLAGDGVLRSYTLYVEGGGYRLVSADPPVDSITPEFYCEATQR